MNGARTATLTEGWRLSAIRSIRSEGFPLIATSLLGLLLFVALFANVLAPHDPEVGSLGERFRPPVWQQGGSEKFLLGSDHLGRDVLSRVIFGARVSLAVGFAAVAVGGAVGGALGLLAGYHGGWFDEVVMTVADAQLAFPFILLAIGIIAVLGPSFRNLIIVVGLSGWVTYARVLRAQVRALRRREFVDAITALGGTAPRILLRHILPNVASTLMVIATLELARAIVLEATLSFLGLGVQPPTPSWGVMVQEGLEYLDSAWWIAVWPGLVLMLTSIVVSRTGDWLRDVLDPTLRGA